MTPNKNVLMRLPADKMRARVMTRLRKWGWSDHDIASAWNISHFSVIKCIGCARLEQKREAKTMIARVMSRLWARPISLSQCEIGEVWDVSNAYVSTMIRFVRYEHTRAA